MSIPKQSIRVSDRTFEMIMFNNCRLEVRTSTWALTEPILWLRSYLKDLKKAHRCLLSAAMLSYTSSMDDIFPTPLFAEDIALPMARNRNTLISLSVTYKYNSICWVPNSSFVLTDLSTALLIPKDFYTSHRLTWATCSQAWSLSLLRPSYSLTCNPPSPASL